MVVAASTTPNLKPTTPDLRSPSNPRRPPLLDNGAPPPTNPNPNPNLRRPKSREVSSRYLSTSSSSSTSGSSSSTLSNSSYLSSSRRCASPIPANSGAIKRPMSVERRRPVTPPMTAAAKMLVSSSSSSARRLSVSFQGESFQVSKSKSANAPKTVIAAPSPAERRKTPAVASPTGKKNGPAGHMPWPGRSRPLTGPAALSRSLDLGREGVRLSNGSTKVVRALRESLIADANDNANTNASSTNSKVSSDEKLRRSMSSRDETVKWVQDARDASCVNGDGTSLGSESLVLDTDSVSSECNSGSQESNASVGGGSKGAGSRARSIVVPARVWGDGNNSRMKQPGSPVARSSSFKGTVASKLIVPKKVMGNDSPGASPRGAVNTRGMASPIRGSVRPASPSPSMLRTSVGAEKSSPFRGMASPSRVRNASPSRARNPSPSRVRNVTSGAVANTVPSLSQFPSSGADVRRAKVVDNRLGDGHLLRLLYNRHLQWRFVNARTEASLSVQTINAERSLYNAWKTTSDLRGVVSYKRKELQWLRQKLKLVSILKDQMQYLEEWAVMENDHCSSLSGATESLKASIIRLPVVGGARADVQDMKDAICSAADVMHAMASSICSLLEKVEDVNSLMAEVANITSKEHSLLNECKEILSTLAAMQVKDCSLRAHLLQIKSTTSRSTAGT